MAASAAAAAGGDAGGDASESAENLSAIPTLQSHTATGVRWAPEPVEGAAESLLAQMDSQGLPARQIAEIVTARGDQCVIAGSAVLRAVMDAKKMSPNWTPSDFDLFYAPKHVEDLVVLREELRDANLQESEASREEYSRLGAWSIHRVFEYQREDSAVLQVIVRVAVTDQAATTTLASMYRSSVFDMVATFDFDVVKLAFDGERVLTTDCAAVALKNGILGIPARVRCRSEAVGKLGDRIVKYEARGFGGSPQVIVIEFVEEYGGRKYRVIGDPAEPRQDSILSCYEPGPLLKVRNTTDEWPPVHTRCRFTRRALVKSAAKIS